MTEREEARREILQAARRRGVDQRQNFLVGNNCVQGWDAWGYSDLATAFARAYDLANKATSWGHPEVLVLDIDSGDLCKLQMI